MKNTRILISGAGIAGPALAFWLRRHGFEPTIIEKAPAVRTGGYAVDFRGSVHLGLLKQMGLLDSIRRQQTNMGDTLYVDARGRKRSSLPADFLSGDLEILRGDLGQILHDATSADATYIFDDHITALAQDEAGVEVSFASSPQQRFDLVVGADGLHSSVRTLAFDNADTAVKSFGYHIAIFTTANILNLDRRAVFYNEPGRSVGMYSARNNTEAKAVFSFATPGKSYGRLSRAEHETILHDAFSPMKWETSRILEAMPDAPDLYFDSISQVRLNTWSANRITLLGDAGYCPSPWSGAGTGLALVGAYILAGELKRAEGNHATAFSAYEARMRPYVARAQSMAEGAGDWVAPLERWKLHRRDWLYRTLPMTPWKGMLANIPRKAAEAISLESY